MPNRQQLAHQKTAQRKLAHNTENHLTKIYAAVHRIPLLTSAELEELCRRKDAGDAAAVRAICYHNLRGIFSLIRPYIHLLPSHAADMYMAIVEIMLTRVIPKYKYGQARFLTYAAWWVKATMMVYLSENQSSVKVLPRQRTRRAKLQHMIDQYREQHGRSPDTDTIAAVLKKKRKDVLAMLDWLTGKDISMDDLEVDFGFGAHVKRRLRDPREDQETLLARHELSRKVRLAIAELAKQGLLSPRELTIIEQRLLAEEGEAKTLLELGRQFGCSRERARQLEIRAKNTLRQHLGTLIDPDYVVSLIPTSPR